VIAATQAAVRAVRAAAKSSRSAAQLAAATKQQPWQLLVQLQLAASSTARPARSRLKEECTANAQPARL
jgi:hypothetical protein